MSGSGHRAVFSGRSSSPHKEHSGVVQHDNKPTSRASEKEQLRRHARLLLIINSVSSITKFLIVSSCVVGTTYTGIYLPIQASAGQETTISVLQKWVVDANLQVYLAWGAAAAGTGWALLERRKRLRERSERDKRIVELEHKFDPNRTSSGMTVGGEEEEGGKK